MDHVRGRSGRRGARARIRVGRASANALVETHDNYFKDLADGDTVAASRPANGLSSSRAAADAPRRTTSPSATGPQPSVCNQTKLSPGDTEMDDDGVPPMPNDFHPPGWEGYCRSTRPAPTSSSARCIGGMDGTVIVSGTATPTPTPTPTATYADAHRRQRPPRQRHGDALADGHGDRLADANARPPPPTATADRDRHATATATPPAATPTPAHPAAPTAGPPAPRRRPVAAAPKPKLSAATFKRSSRTVTVSGTLAASGKVRIEVSYRSAPRRARRRSRLTVKNGRFSGSSSSPPTDARRRRSSRSPSPTAASRPSAREGQPLTRSRRCRRSCAASSTSLWRHSAARYTHAISPVRWMRRKSP